MLWNYIAGTGGMEKGDEIHEVSIETIDNEYYVSAAHPMRKEHYISFVAYVTAGTVEIVKLYPEQNIDVRFRKKRTWDILYLL